MNEHQNGGAENTGTATRPFAFNSRIRTGPLMITMNCPHCETSYRLKPEFSGRLVRCRVCQENFRVPDEVPSDDEEGLQTVFFEKDSKAGGKGGRRSKRRQKVDELGFFTDFEDHDHHLQQKSNEQEDEDDDEWVMREAARRGADSFEMPRREGVSQSAYRRKSSGPMIPTVVWLWGAGMICTVLISFVLFNIISNAGLRSSLAGLSVEIASEFEQENDKALGTPAPESARIDNSLQVRDLSKHKTLIRTLTKDFNEMADCLSKVQDIDSAKSNQARLQQLGDHVKEVGSAAASEKLFNPNPKESRLIAREVGGELRKAVGRIRTEMVRLQGIREFSLGTMLAMPRIQNGIREIEREFVEKGEIPDADKYVELRVAGLKTNNEREYIAEKLNELATPKASRKATAPSAATRYTLWPVDSPAIFAKKLDFGKVIRTKGKEVWVVADPIDPSVIRERLAKKEADEQKRKEELEAAQQSAKLATGASSAEASGPGDPEIPANADEVTRGLLMARSSNHFKRQDGLRLLQGANFKGRDQEVFDGLEPLLVDMNIFTIRDAMLVLVRCDTANTIEFLADKLADDRLRDEVIKAVTPMKEVKLAKPLASVMRNDPWKNADKALIAIGSPAEQAVIEQLASPDQGVRQRACEILAEIGTEVSSKAIRKLPADPIPWVRDAAKNALRSIQNRKRLSGPTDTKDSTSPEAVKAKASDI